MLHRRLPMGGISRFSNHVCSSYPSLHNWSTLSAGPIIEIGLRGVSLSTVGVLQAVAPNRSGIRQPRRAPRTLPDDRVNPSFFLIAAAGNPRRA
jgi:hypothetical protein